MILSKKISKKITDTLVTNEIIEPQKEGIYFYCLDFSLDLILFNCSLLLIGGLLGLFLPSLVYIIILVPVRMLAGGAHAKSPYSCFLLSYSIYFLTLFLSRLPYLIMPGLYILLISLLTLIIWGLAPVGNAHKHYTTAERIQNFYRDSAPEIRKLSKIKKILFFLLFFIYAFAVLMLSWKQQLYYHMILICLCIVLINQCIARCLNHRTLHVSKGEKK